jgi:UDP-glucuronate 4-epimerase
VETIAVTGAAGFIGSNLCQALLDSGHQVTGVDNFDPFYDRSLKERWLGQLRPHPSFRFVESDICSNTAIPAWLEGVDAVVHLAALAGVRASVDDPTRYMTVNVGGTTAVLDACRRSGTTRVVIASSSSVYGERGDVCLKESDTNLEPLSPYGVSKYTGELIARLYAGLYGLRIAALRFFSVYGPRQRPDQAICRFHRLLTTGQPLECFGDGSATRDYTHVDDVVTGILAALGWVGASEPDFEVFNIGSAKPVALQDLIELLGRLVGVTPIISKKPQPVVDVSRTCASIEKASSVLGYAPQVALEDGLARFIEWHEVTHGH